MISLGLCVSFSCRRIDLVHSSRVFLLVNRSSYSSALQMDVAYSVLSCCCKIRRLASKRMK